MERTITEISLFLRKGGLNNNRPNRAIINFLEHSFDALPDLLAFDYSLADDEPKRRQFAQKICEQDGLNLQKAISKAMATVMADQLTTRYTWSGHTRADNILRVSTTKFAQIITDILRGEHSISIRNV
ncbi:uncharacterized protein [Neodiprion pinetum]|uniref:uncharacterized protein n=1 Tax=Neodiprion pinetum TaxID=441929 RepID=UPI001EE033AE|nr:uncharacterized protein LOC124218252 [Neodiprion pinetum]